MSAQTALDGRCHRRFSTRRLVGDRSRTVDTDRLRARTRCSPRRRSNCVCSASVNGCSGFPPVGFRVFAVAGGNERLRRQLEARSLGSHGRGPGIDAFGFTDQIPLLMAAADVVLTSPGQTCHEARVVGRPLVVLDVVPGHGRENLLLELEHGGALACTPHPPAVVRAVRAARRGIAPAASAWPVADARDWDRWFLSVLRDLIPVVSSGRGTDAERVAV